MGEENEEPRTVIVGVKMDPESRELLTWALVKVARPGDLVVALHVIPSTSAAAAVSDPNGKCSSLLSLVKAFDSVLAVYEGFCNLKQIELKLKLCRGSSIRKILVKEAKAYGASSLILGIDKNCHGIRHSSTSIAKYCSKKLPKDCSVLAVSNGKIVFPRESTESRGHDYLLAFRGHQPNFFDDSRPSCEVNHSDLRNYDCSVCSSKLEDKDQNHTKSRKDGCLPLVGPDSVSLRESHGVKPGWHLLQKAVLTDRKSTVDEKSKVSVQWAMRLPSLYTATSPIHLGHRHTKFTGEPVGRTDSSCAPLALFHKDNELPEELRFLREKYSSVCKIFNYKELKLATSNFSSENLIGRGGSSRVYKGYLSDGKELAVKVLKQSEDAMKEFVSEIEIITALNHKNIISLFGFCFGNDNLILVYNYLAKGSLEEMLHGDKERKYTLSWPERYKIAMGVAEALDYLHNSGSVQPVIHRDVKSSNILLSPCFDPQLADFGLAMWESSSSLHMACNDVAGTFGYLAPEYFMYGKVSKEIDVYAFGVVLLELLSGRKPVSTQCPKGEESLVLWANKILHDGKMKELVDPRLSDKYDNDQMERMIVAAYVCIRKSPRSRPCMSLVLKLLQGDPDALTWSRSQINASDGFEEVDNEATTPSSDIQSHINLAFQDVEDDTPLGSTNHTVDFIAANTSLEEYLKERWSRTSSFN